MATSAAAVVEADTAVCQSAQKFSKLFYEAFDRRRNLVSKMYTDHASMVWNGEPLQGQSEIAKFIEKLPESEHTIRSLDAHHVNEQAMQGQKTILLLVAGLATYGGMLRSFTQTFVLVQEDNVWKIASDRFRFID